MTGDDDIIWSLEVTSLIAEARSRKEGAVIVAAHAEVNFRTATT